MSLVVRVRNVKVSCLSMRKSFLEFYYRLKVKAGLTGYARRSTVSIIQPYDKLKAGSVLY